MEVPHYGTTEKNGKSYPSEGMDVTRNCSKKLGMIAIGLAQGVMIVLFFFFARYDNHIGKSNSEVDKYYPMWQDVNVMIFVGIGFLLTFLKRYGYSSFGINLLLGAFCVELGFLATGIVNMLYMGLDRFQLDMPAMFNALFSAATVLITFCAVLGKTSISQLFVMAVIEVILAAINALVVTSYLQVSDLGGSLLIHAFGGYFGMSAARVLYNPEADDSEKEGAVYHSDIFSLIGTAFLWCYWPSFNAGMALGDARYRAIINTFLSMSAATVATFCLSKMLNRDGKLEMVHIQNSTLAGGVAVGAMANFVIQPYGAVIMGSIAGCLSVAGFKYITPWLRSHARIHDTCGVNNLHCMPGILSGVGAAIAALMATHETYGDSLYVLFPAMRSTNTTSGVHIPGRSAELQGGYQALGIVCTLGISIVGGAITGLLMRLPCLNPPRGIKLFDDEENWNVPEDFALQGYDVGTDEEKLLSGDT